MSEEEDMSGASVKGTGSATFKPIASLTTNSTLLQHPLTDDDKTKEQQLLRQQADQLQKEQEAFIALERESQNRRIAAAQQQQLQLEAQNRYEQQLLQQLQNLSK